MAPVLSEAVDGRITRIVKTLKDAGFETYIVGGAIRDILLGRRPKDYDISTAATPEQVVSVFGRRQARVIGKRFRLVHLHCGEDIIEISTFRRAPEQENQRRRRDDMPENMITSDNDFGTPVEDAFRRDFTVNALFYDPVEDRVVDHTGHGRDDIEKKLVRAIGDPALRFEEDPVRMLRALKLVGQYDFALESKTENALFSSLPLIEHASVSRLSLELEKVLSSSYGDKHLVAFHDYGFLNYFLPFFGERYHTEEMALALDLLAERNCRVLEGCYRNSVSLAMAVLLLPFLEKTAQDDPQLRIPAAAEELVEHAFLPQTMIKRLLFSAERILELFIAMRRADRAGRLIENRSYGHARELMLIYNEVVLHDESMTAKWPPSFGDEDGYRSSAKARKRSGRPPRKRNPKPENNG